MPKIAKIRVQRYCWADKVAAWRSRAPQQRAAIDRGTTRYYFGIRRFIHCIEVETLSQMEYVAADYSAT